MTLTATSHTAASAFHVSESRCRKTGALTEAGCDHASRERDTPPGRRSRAWRSIPALRPHRCPGVPAAACSSRGSDRGFPRAISRATRDRSARCLRVVSRPCGGWGPRLVRSARRGSSRSRRPSGSDGHTLIDLLEVEVHDEVCAGVGSPVKEVGLRPWDRLWASYPQHEERSGPRSVLLRRQRRRRPLRRLKHGAPVRLRTLCGAGGHGACRFRPSAEFYIELGAPRALRGIRAEARVFRALRRRFSASSLVHRYVRTGQSEALPRFGGPCADEACSSTVRRWHPAGSRRACTSRPAYRRPPPCRRTTGSPRERAGSRRACART